MLVSFVGACGFLAFLTIMVFEHIYWLACLYAVV